MWKSKGGWNAAIFIIGVEFAQQFTFFGLVANLVIYLPKEFNMSITEAVKSLNTWGGVSSLFPLLGGFIADSYLGRFNTIIISSLIYLLGLTLLTLSVSVKKNETLFFSALYVLAVGDGGHKPCVQTFAADQFDEDSEEGRKAQSSFFNWWYLSRVIGAVSAVFAIPYLEDNISWALGMEVVTGVMVGAFVLFLVGITKYKKESPKGSPITSIAQVLVAASRKWRVKYTPGDNNYWYGDDNNGVSHHSQVHTLVHTDEYRCLDKATIIDDIDASRNTRNPWRLCSVTQVEEVKLIIRLIPIWLSCLMFTVVQSQLGTFFTAQGKTLDCSIGPHFKIPPGSLQGIVGLVIFVALPIYDRIVVPIATKFTGHESGITVLQRIGVGLFLSIINMVVAGLVELKRIGVASNHNLLDNNTTKEIIIPMKIWWLLPQYAILAFSDVFTIVGLQELFYTQMPETMRSLGAAAYISIVGVGSFVSNAIIVSVMAITARAGDKWLGNNINRAHLHHFYWLLAGLSSLSFCVYLWFAKRFVYKKVHVAAETRIGGG